MLNFMRLFASPPLPGPVVGLPVLASGGACSAVCSLQMKTWKWDQLTRN